MGDERVPVELDAQIRWAGSFYRYPLQFVDMVRGMDKRVLAHCVLGLLATEVHNKFGGYREPQNAEEALAQLYGWPLYEFSSRSSPGGTGRSTRARSRRSSSNRRCPD